MRDVPHYMVSPKLGEERRAVLLRTWSDSQFDAVNAARDRNPWLARRYAETCRMLATAFGTKVSADVRAEVRRSQQRARATLAGQGA